MIGVVSVLGVLALILAGIIFLLELPLIKLTGIYMESKSNTWRNAAKLAALIVFFNLIVSILMALLKLGTAISVLLGIVLFVVFVFLILKKIYKSIDTKQRIFFTAVLLIFSLVINFVLMLLMNWLIMNIKII